MKIFVGILLFIFMLVQVDAQTLDNALQYLKQKNYVAAIDACNSLLANSPNDPSVLGVRSLAYTASGKYDQGVQDADKALSVDNTSAWAHYAKAEVLYAGTKEYDKALEEYNAAISSNARMEEAYVGKTRAYMGMQNYRDATRVIDDAIKMFPNNAELYFTQGQLDFQRGKPKQAIEGYDKSLSVNAKWNPFLVYLNRGLANEALINYEPAIQDFSKAIAADPNNPAAFIARGNIRYAQYQYTEAIDDFKKAEILSPNNSVITYNIGMAYYRNEDRSSACKYFQKSCSQGNSNACKMVVLNCTDRKLN